MGPEAPERKLRIAMLGLRTIGHGSGGVERAVEELGVRLVQRGHAVTVFCRTRYNRPPLSSFSGVRLVNLPALYTKHLEAITHTALGALRCLWGFDVVHIHAVGPSLLSFVPRLAGRRVVVTVHAFDWKREKWGPAARIALRVGGWCAAKVPQRTIVVSRILRDHFASAYGRPPTYIPNGVPRLVRRPPDGIRRFGIEGGDYLLFLGRLVPEKGCHTLVQAFRGLATDAKLLVVGDATHTEGYAQRVRELAAGDPRIVFTGPLYGSDKEEAYANALALVFPSTLEGMPIVLLEAMSLGCPILASDIPENLEVVRPGPAATQLAEVFSAGSTEELRAKLRALLESPTAARPRAERAAAHVHEAYAWERIVAQTESVYLEPDGASD